MTFESLGGLNNSGREERRGRRVSPVWSLGLCVKGETDSLEGGWHSLEEGH